MSTAWPTDWPKITATAISVSSPQLGTSTSYTRGTSELWLEEGCFKTVERGDTVSGYSMILYGNYSALNVWGRAKKAVLGTPKSMADLIPLESANMIRSGETLVHVGEFLKKNQTGAETRGTRTRDDRVSNGANLGMRATPNVRLISGMEIVAADFSWFDENDFSGLDRAAISEYYTMSWFSSFVPLTDIPSFVKNVKAKAGARPISILHIQVHGSPGSMFFGTNAGNGDALHSYNFDQYSPELKKLKTNLRPGSWVVVRSCKTGQSLALLRKLRDLWGVNIFGGIGNWRNVIDYNLVGYVVLEAGGAEYQTSSMPGQIQHSVMRMNSKNHP